MESGHAHDHPLNSELHGIAVIAASLRRIHCRSHCSAQGSPCGASLAPSRPPVRCLAPASRYAAVRVLCAFSQRFRTHPGTWPCVPVRSSFPRRRRTSCAASVATRHRCACSQQLPSHRARCSPSGPSPPFQGRLSPCGSAASPLMTATTAEVRRLGRTRSRLCHQPVATVDTQQLTALDGRDRLPLCRCFAQAPGEAPSSGLAHGFDPADPPAVVFVLGGPGAGKGTQCSKLVRDSLRHTPCSQNASILTL